MPLINCPECKKEISDSAKICPNCGYDLKKKVHKNIIISTIILFLFAIFILVFVLKSLFGKPEGLSEEAYNFGNDALIVTDKYIDGDYDADVARNRLDDIKNELDGLYKTDNSVDTFSLSVDVSGVSTYILIGSESDILKSRNELAKSLHKKKR